MDHRISKDMISSGMIPSGEKNQEDLGKTQYGTVPSPNALSDVYKKMYETKEEVINEHHKKDADGNTIPHEGEEINEILGMGTIATAGKALLTRIGKTAIGSQVKNIGKKVVKDFKKNPLDTAVKASVVANSIPKPGMPNVPAVEKPKSQGGMRSTQYASADLFDIVKGQLLDEGLSEEEIRDIMLTLTPDEIMEELSDIVKRNDAINKANAMKAAEKKQVPQEVRDASKRQYTAGGPKDTGSNKYTTQDKKTIINYNKDKGSM